MPNICQCPIPPGGQATCNDDQLAICRVINGVAHTECIDVPDQVGSLTSTRGRNWILSEVTMNQRDPLSVIDPSELNILNSGRYRVPGTSDVIHFRVPVARPRGRPVGA
jgi:hypothetical protein